MANLELSCSAALQPAVRQQYGHFSLLISHRLVMRRLLLQSPNRNQHSNDLAGAGMDRHWHWHWLHSFSGHFSMIFGVSSIC